MAEDVQRRIYVLGRASSPVYTVDDKGLEQESTVLRLAVGLVVNHSRFQVRLTANETVGAS